MNKNLDDLNWTDARKAVKGKIQFIKIMKTEILAIENYLFKACR